MIRSGLRTLLFTSVLAAGCAQPVPLVNGPDSAPPDVREALAEGDAQTGRAAPEAALRAYRAAVTAQPGAVAAHLRYIAAMQEVGRHAAVRDEYAKRAEQPGASTVDRVMAQRLGTDGSSSALRRVYTLAAMTEPENPWWPLALAEVEITEADAWNARRQTAADRGDHEAERSGFAQAKGAAARADTAVRKAAALAPRMAEVSLYQGHLRAVEGDLQASSVARRAAYDAAEAAFVRATTLDADLVEAFTGLGDVRFRQGNLGDALTAYVRAVRLAPADAHARLSLGVVLHELDRHDDAAAQYSQAAALRPWDADPVLRLGDARADASRWSAALEAYADALRRDPAAVEAHYKSGTVLEHLGRLGDARAAYERYVDGGGEHASGVARRIERLLRADDRGRTARGGKDR